MAVLTLCAAGAHLSVMGQQQSQPQQQQTQQLQRVEVTGSNIKRTDMETASPVTVITREDMVRSGASTLGDVISRLTVVQGGLSGVEFSGFTPGAATISLRGLGGGATLVLINGRRIAPYGVTGFQEVLTSVNAIPVSAIDRIDILKDGASAIYGSEAIAGVVNIILRGDFTGLEAAVQHGFNENGALGVTSFNLSGGIGDIAADRYNIFAIYEHLSQDHATVSDNRFYPSRNLAPKGIPVDGRSSYAYPGNLLTGTISMLPGTDCDPANQRVVGGVTRCVLDVFEYNTMAPKAERDSLFVRGNVQLSANLTGFFDAGLGKSKYGYQFDPQFYYNDYDFQTLVTDGAPYGIAGPVDLLYRAGDLGPRKFNVTSDEMRVLAGLKGTLGSWDFDSAIGTMQNKVRIDQLGSILITPMDEALANGTYVPGMVNDPAVLAQISPALSRKGKATTTFADARVSTEFSSLTLPGGAVGFAAGVEARRETQKDEFDERFVTGEVFGFGSLDPLDAKRTVKSAYAEVNLPILRTLESQLALRHDRYSVGGKSTTPKVGLKWTALPSLVLRGTYARGFRAANPRETNPAVSVGFYNGVQDPVLCPVIDTTNPNCSLSLQANISGNPNLSPEKSKSYTVGMVFEPAKDMSVSVDYWRIDRTAEITNLDLTHLLANQGAYSQFIQRDSSGSISEVDLPYVNLAGTSVRGWDVDFRGQTNLGEAGKLSYGAAATYFEHFYVQPAPDTPSEDYNGTWQQPRLRMNARIGLETGPWTTELLGNYVGGYKNRPTPSGVCSAPAALSQFCSIKPWATLGLFVRYKGFKNTELSLAIDNIGDEKPPFDYRSAVNNQTQAWSTNYHNAWGRSYKLRMKYTFF
ncbi:TonB-dependent receptor [Piscinibacter sp.]|uniref:TonB-dependent receptor n=1 Tax=Piscinibacter sp. TaxID=1903157 RepID=UPI0039E453E8